MKTIKIFISAVAIIFAISCVPQHNYRMVTKLNRDGKAHRDIYTFGDSAFMSGNISENPFLFDISSNWNITRFDTSMNYDFFGEKIEYNVKISKSASSIEQYSKEANYDKDKKSFAAPEELLTKKFGLFYTRYYFKAVYKKLEYEVPVSIDNYLSKEEQIIWTQGNTDIYKTLNGCEINDYLNRINGKFLEWSSQNQFEISLKCIKKLTTEYDLDANKENIYELIDIEKEISPEIVCSALGSFFKTDYFSKLYQAKKEILDKDFEYAIPLNLMGITISYELEIPVSPDNKTVKTNAQIIDWKGVLIWKVDGMRLLFDDYSLNAEYKVLNKWAVFITLLLLFIAVSNIIVLVRKKGCCHAK